MGISHIKPIDSVTGDKKNDYMVICAYCSKDMSICKIEPACADTVKMQQYLYGIIESGHDGNNHRSVEYFQVFHHICCLLLRSKAPSRMKSHIAPFYRSIHEDHRVPYFASPKIVPYISHLPLKKRMDIVTMAYSLLQDWPNKILELSKTHRLTSTMLLEGFKEPPLWYSKTILRELPKQIDRLKKSPNQDNRECTIKMKGNRLHYDQDYYYEDNSCKVSASYQD